MRADRSSLTAQNRLWCVTLVYLAIALAWFLICGFRFRLYEAAEGSIPLVIGPLTARYLLRRFPEARRVAFALSGMLQYAVLSLATAMMAFCAATLCWPLQDTALLAIDRAMGYDWQNYLRLVSSHPLLSRLYGVGYASILWQPIVIFFVLSILGMERRLVIYQTATFVTLVFAVVIFAVVPVTTAWAHDHLATPELRRLGLPTGDDGWIHLLIDLRAGRSRMVAWGMDAGIIGFPSFHCAAALLNGWAMWRERMIRPFWIALNGVMIAATPLMGGHYIADLIAGAILVPVSIVLATRLYPIFADARQATAEPPQQPRSDVEQQATA